MSLLSLRLLGPLRLTVDNLAVRIERRKVAALLAYLAVTGRGHGRDELAEFLSPGRDRARALSNLRQTLSFLGKAVGSHHLAAGRAEISLASRADLRLDVRDYRRLLGRAREADARGDTAAVQARLVEATTLYRGQFLSGFYLTGSPAFEEWQLGLQDELRQLQSGALRRLVEIHAACGKYEEAVEQARRWSALDALDEEAHRELIRLYELGGRHADALRQYERCRAILRRELGQEPSAETARLHRHIETGTLAAGAGPDRRMTPRARPGGSEPRPGCLFLFARLVAVDDGLRAAVVAARGRFFSQEARSLCALVPTVHAALRVVLQEWGSVPSAARSGRAALLACRESADGEGPSPTLEERAKLFLDSSHPGQILLDEPAARLAGTADLPEGLKVRSLGWHRFRDLGPPRLIHQLEHLCLPGPFPRLSTLDACPNNLPVQPSAFIGREKELAAIQDLLLGDEARLLTLTGSGGTGKTRLALQAAAGIAERFQHGVFLIDLAPLGDPAGLHGAIAAQLGVPEPGDSTCVGETLRGYLEGRRMLLLLDNFEHILAAAAAVAGLLRDSPGLKVLVTSRERLRLRVEHVFPLGPMRIPERGQRAEFVMRSEAVRLFAQRAAAADPGFFLSSRNAAAVGEICIRLDGLPLAIELAAAHVRTRGLKALRDRLGSRLALLVAGPRDLPARQQTLRSEMEWSHDLLGEQERRVFRRIAVFPGGCAPEAAEAVCRLPGEELDVLGVLSALADKSLVTTAEGSAGRRVRMLETIREYALEQLVQSGERDLLEGRLAEYAVRFAEQAESMLYGPDQRPWLERLDAEQENLRAALSLLSRGATVARGLGTAGGLRLAGALGWYWFRRARFTEGEHWLKLFRAAASESDLPAERAKVSYYLGWMALCVGRAFWGNPDGKLYFRESLGLSDAAGDQVRLALSQVWLGWKEGGVEGTEGWKLADESVAMARRSGDHWAISWCLKVAFSNLQRADKDLRTRKAALEEALSLARSTGDQFLLCQVLVGMGNVHAWIGDLADAVPWYLDALRIAREISDTWSLLDTVNCLADAWLGLGQIPRAKELFREGLRMAAELGAKAYLGWFIGGLYGAARREGLSTKAVRLGAASEAILNPSGRFEPALADGLGIAPAAAEKEWQRGRAMTLDRLVAYALSDD